MKGIRVSVVVAVYNAEKYLRQTIESIQNQTLKEIEMIFVDDNSTDSSLAILQEYAQKDNRIRVFVNYKESDGAAAARNLGVASAKGEYLSVLDADDFFEPDMLEKLWKTAVETGSDTVICDGYRYDDINSVDLERNSILVRDKLPDGRTIFIPKDNADNLFIMTIGAAWNAMFSMTLVRREQLCFQSFHHADDFEFVYLGFAKSNRIAVVMERLVHYRVNHFGSQASNVNQWPDTAWRSMKSFRERLIADGLYTTYRVAFSRVAMRYFRFYLDSMKNVKKLSVLFDNLKTTYMQELDLLHTTETEFDDHMLFELRNVICNNSFEEYLFKRLKNEKPFDKAIAWMKKVPQNSDIVIYGADRMGVDVFYSVLANRNYRVSAWVDKQYQELGYPVMNPNLINEISFDYVVVTILSEKTFFDIQKFLISIGVGTEQIIWLMDK